MRQVSKRLGIYVLNSINPFRLEGQKSIMFEALQQLRWQVPDWIVVPGGNLGNSSAFGKGLREMYEVGLIDRLPRLAIIQAEGANPLYQHFATGFRKFEPVAAKTIATAIKIGNPVNLQKAIRALEWTGGVVEEVSDQAIMDAKAVVDGVGIGCEPASACSVAGVRKLARRGIIKRGDTVLGVLTGHILKDPEATIGYHADELARHRSRGIARISCCGRTTTSTKSSPCSIGKRTTFSADTRHRQSETAAKREGTSCSEASRSAMISSASSMPSAKRTRLSRMPTSSLSSLLRS